LASLGAREIERSEYMTILKRHLNDFPTIKGRWNPEVKANG